MGKTATHQEKSSFAKHFVPDISKRKTLGNILAGSLISPKRVEAMYTDPSTKIVLPEVGEIESAIPSSFDDNPFEGLDKSSFSRLDQTADTIFYKAPRFTEHVDQNAVRLMNEFISQDVLKESDTILDLCTSWTSHIDQSTVDQLKIKRISGLGMNEEEMKKNSILNDYTVVDLNTSPDVKLPYKDQSFNVVLCQLSIDYLIHPLEVMKEVGRVLKPGGKVVILFSNRLFIQKVRKRMSLLHTGFHGVEHRSHFLSRLDTILCFTFD